MKCCLWLVFKVELIVVQRRAGQGQCQATHNKHIPGSFTCYASQETCFTQAAGLCGRMGRIFLLMCVQKKKLYQARHKSQPPTYQTRHIRLRHLLEKPNPQPFSLPSVLQLPLLFLSVTTPLLCLPSPSLPGRGLMSWEPEEDERGKAGMLRPREAIGLTPRYLKEEIFHWHCDKDPNQPGPPMKASGMISCSREDAKNRNACVWKTAWRCREGGHFWESQAAGNDNQKYVIDCNK